MPPCPYMVHFFIFFFLLSISYNIWCFSSFCNVWLDWHCKCSNSTSRSLTHLYFMVEWFCLIYDTLCNWFSLDLVWLFHLTWQRTSQCLKVTMNYISWSIDFVYFEHFLQIFISLGVYDHFHMTIDMMTLLSCFSWYSDFAWYLNTFWWIFMINNHQFGCRWPQKYLKSITTCILWFFGAV